MRHKTMNCKPCVYDPEPPTEEEVAEQEEFDRFIFAFETINAGRWAIGPDPMELHELDHDCLRRI